MADSPCIIVFMTAPDEDTGTRIGRTLVEERLAACCNIIPKIRSIYRWKGKVHDEREVLCVMKTREELFESLKARIKEIHPYEVPEVISVGISNGLGIYLDWIDENTR